MDADGSLPRSPNRPAAYRMPKPHKLKRRLKPFFIASAVVLVIALLLSPSLYQTPTNPAQPTSESFAQTISQTAFSEQQAMAESQSIWATPYPITTAVLIGLYVVLLVWFLLRAHSKSRRAEGRSLRYIALGQSRNGRP